MLDVILERSKFISEYDDIEILEDFVDFVKQCIIDDPSIADDVRVQNAVFNAVIKWTNICKYAYNDIECTLQDEDDKVLVSEFKKDLQNFESYLKNL